MIIDCVNYVLEKWCHAQIYDISILVMHRADFERATGGHGHGQFFSYGQRAGTGKPGFFVQGNGQGRVLVFGQRAGKRAFLKWQKFP